MGLRKIQFSILLLIPLILSIGLAPALTSAYAASNFDAESQCKLGKVLVYRANVNNYVCLSEDSEKSWTQLGLGIIVEASTVQNPMEQKTSSTKAYSQITEQHNISVIMVS